MRFEFDRFHNPFVPDETIQQRDHLGTHLKQIHHLIVPRYPDIEIHYIVRLIHTPNETPAFSLHCQVNTKLLEEQKLITTHNFGRGNAQINQDYEYLLNTMRPKIR